MDMCGVYLSLENWIVDTHRPFVPYFRLGVVSPDADAYFLTLEDDERLFHWEIQGEPTVHAWGVHWWIGAVENVLVEFSCEVPTKSMNLTLFFLNCKNNPIIFLQALLLTLCFTLEFFLIRVWQMSESEYFPSLIPTWESCWVDLHDVRELEGIQLLGNWHSWLETLGCVDVHFVPNNLRWKWNNIVSVGVRDENTTFFKEFRGWVETFGT